MCVSMTAFSRRGFITKDIARQFNGKHPGVYSSRSEILLNNTALSRRCTTSSCIAEFQRVFNILSCGSRAFSSAKIPTTFDDITEPLTKQQAKDLMAKLSPEEQELFLDALIENKSEEKKAGYEGKLAAFRWRSKLGRPSKLPSLGEVDPTGTYCPVPEDWLNRKYEPTSKDLTLVAIANAIPFVGFGFLDNFIMIVAGDQIEMILNAKFPISTMAAAALGNTVSDVIGIGSVHYVEKFAQRVGFEAPKLTPAQLTLPKTRLAVNLGRVIGVTIGCLIGMTPIPMAALFRSDS